MDPYYVNDFFQKERKKHGISQYRLAQLLGVTRQAISNIELYKNKVSYEVIEKFCEVFGYKLYFQTYKQELIDKEKLKKPKRIFTGTLKEPVTLVYRD